MTSTPRDHAITDLTAISDSLEAFAKKKHTDSGEGDSLGMYTATCDWKAEAEFLPWRKVAHRMKTDGIDMVDAVRKVQRALFRDLLSPQETDRDALMTLRDLHRLNGYRTFLRETGQLVGLDLELPACPF